MSPLRIDIVSKMLLRAAPIIIPIGKTQTTKIHFFHTSHAIHNSYKCICCAHTLSFAFALRPEAQLQKWVTLFVHLPFLGGLSLAKVSPTHSGDGWAIEVQKGPFFPSFFLIIKLSSLHLYFVLYIFFSFSRLHSFTPHSYTHSFIYSLIHHSIQNLIDNTSYSHTTLRTTAHYHSNTTTQ